MEDFFDLRNYSKKGFSNLISAGVDVNAKNEDGDAPLHRCCHPIFFKALLEAGAKPNVRNSEGHTPLHLHKNLKILEMLLEAGADVNARDKKGRSPLYWIGNHFFQNEELKRLKFLINAGADVNCRNNLGETVLHNCMHYKIMEFFLLSGADPNARDNKGRTPLHIPCNEFNQPENSMREYSGMSKQDSILVRKNFLKYRKDVLLLKFGADPNAVDDKGNTPLHYSVCNVNAGFLIKAGADPTIKNNVGKVPKLTSDAGLNFHLRKISELEFEFKQRKRLLNAVNKVSPINERPSNKRKM